MMLKDGLASQSEGNTGKESKLRKTKTLTATCVLVNSDVVKLTSKSTHHTNETQDSELKYRGERGMCG